MENKKNEPNSSAGSATDRRGFMTKTALLGAGLAVGSLSWAASADQSKDSKSAKASMTTRKLGNLEVSAIGAGCMSISAN